MTTKAQHTPGPLDLASAELQESILTFLDRIERALAANYATPDTREGRIAVALMNDARALLARIEGGK
jgi:hypothetical protein